MPSAGRMKLPRRVRPVLRDTELQTRPNHTRSTARHGRGRDKAHQRQSRPAAGRREAAGAGSSIRAARRRARKRYTMPSARRFALRDVDHCCARGCGIICGYASPRRGLTRDCRCKIFCRAPSAQSDVHSSAAGILPMPPLRTLWLSSTAASSCQLPPVFP